MWWTMRIWLPIAVAVTGMCGLLYMSMQSIYREGLNDPQIQMVEDAAASLAAEFTPAAVVPRGAEIDIAESQLPWIAVYDENGTPLESSGIFENAPPKPPEGVFDAARNSRGKGTDQFGQNRLTWQPSPDVRVALVVQYVGGDRPAYIAAGRNMEETERRIWRMEAAIAGGWLVILAATLIMSWIGSRVRFGTAGIVWDD